VYYVHVNKNVIASNRKHGKSDPAVRVQKGKYGKPIYAFRVRFQDGEMIYSPDKPILPCGARMVIQTEHDVEILE
jgi:hypothetical protein